LYIFKEENQFEYLMNDKNQKFYLLKNETFAISNSFRKIWCCSSKVNGIPFVTFLVIQGWASACSTVYRLNGSRLQSFRKKSLARLKIKLKILFFSQSLPCEKIRKRPFPLYNLFHKLIFVGIFVRMFPPIHYEIHHYAATPNIHWFSIWLILD